MFTPCALNAEGVLHARLTPRASLALAEGEEDVAGREHLRVDHDLHAGRRRACSLSVGRGGQLSTQD